MDSMGVSEREGVTGKCTRGRGEREREREHPFALNPRK